MKARIPVPDSPEDWLREIVKAYLDAYEAIPFGPLAGRAFGPKDLFQLGPVVCLKFRGLGRSEKLRKKATEAALASYVGMEEYRPEALSSPQMAFAFCYIISHLALDLIQEEAANEIMDYVETNQDRLQSLSEDNDE